MQRGLETNLQYEILSKMDRSCVPNLTGLEVKIKLENCNKRATEEVPVLVHTVCKEELSRNLRGMGITW